MTNSHAKDIQYFRLIENFYIKKSRSKGKMGICLAKNSWDKLIRPEDSSPRSFPASL